MRGAIKLAHSKILSEALTYKKGDSKNNRKITEILLQEQKGFCAYTDEFISITDAKDVEHFNPTLKYTAEDNYENWFFVKHKWNTMKSTKWDKFQPVLIPTDPNFENRIVYFEGEYLPSSTLDNEAQNLISLLQLDNAALAKKRKQYIERKRNDMKEYNQTPSAFFLNLVKADPCQVHYTRAIKEEFGIDVLDMIG
jgi:hypothetical protein